MTAGRMHPPRRLGHLGCFVLAAVGLHVAVALGLGLRLQAQAMRAGGQHTTSHTTSHTASHVAMQVRWQVDAKAKAPLAATDASDTDLPPSTTATAMAADLADTHIASAEATTTDATDNITDATNDYARRDTLDRGPQALGIVQIAYPPGVDPGGVHTGHLTLLIDETGAVRKVMPMDQADADKALPPPFIEAARLAFLQARFSPGERQGMAVKSRIDIEVSFDDRPVEAMEAIEASASHKPVAATDRPT